MAMTPRGMGRLRLEPARAPSRGNAQHLENTPSFLIDWSRMICGPYRAATLDLGIDHLKQPPR